ncbi:BQ2448_351 [Microbotryum intermedium]|uniref:BQ2448_351 protein n=1 Tax=Microbotryum intermedium TaxID=269621 RepID=A0A238F276_9BASI|nr:BQ2448_351 [Microbotryum intermedium]
MSFATIPRGATLDPKPFKISFSGQELSDLAQLARLGRLPVLTWVQTDRKYGVKREWIVEAKKRWEDGFDWRKREAKINEIPQWKADIEDDQGTVHSVHFAALFSPNPNAKPIAFFHGWPGMFFPSTKPCKRSGGTYQCCATFPQGSFLEFIPILTDLKTRYAADPSSLPFHVIVPSLIGYTFTSGPPTDRDYDVIECSKVMDKLLVGLGCSGYIAQGGDIGSWVSRYLGVKSDHCIAVHLNFAPVPTPQDFDVSSLEEYEQVALKRAEKWRKEGSAYANFHATRPSTIGFVLQSSPLALLAWVGEKFLDWSDEDLSIDDILESVTVWYLTDTIARSVYPYREVSTPVSTGVRPSTVHGGKSMAITKPEWFISKPMGFSWFPQELMPTPRVLIEKTGNVVNFTTHKSGGHFAAFEKPKELWKDVENFANQVFGTMAKM